MSLDAETLSNSSHPFLDSFLASPYAWRGDEVAEWLRRWTANPLCSARMVRIPSSSENFIHVVDAETLSNSSHPFLDRFLASPYEWRR